MAPRKRNPASTPKVAQKAKATARQVRIASKLIAGQSVAAIARDEGLARETVSRQINQDPRQVQIIAELAYQFRPALNHLYPKVLLAIEEGLQAEAIRSTKEGDTINLGPDHYARLAAAKRFIEICLAGRPVPKFEEVDTRGSTANLPWEEIVDRIQAAQLANPTQRHDQNDIGSKTARGH